MNSLDVKPGRRPSVMPPDGAGGGLTPLLTAPHRRMSRMEVPMANRRMSMAAFRRPSVAASFHSTERSHLSGPPQRIQNTYKLGPDEGEKFSAGKIEKAVTGILETFLDEQIYEPIKCAKLSQSLGDVIRNRVKEMNFPRYKIVTHVVIGQNTGQGLECASRCMWSPSTDSFASVNYKNPHIFAVATVFGSYFE